jgi:hypothetical protein
MKRFLPIACVLFAWSSSCSLHRNDLSGIYSDFRSDIERHAGVPHDDAAIERQNERAEKVKKIVDANGLKTTEDYFEASLILVQTDDVEMLKLSENLALKAAEMGDKRGFRIAAEAQDRQLVRVGLAQRFGTQYIYEPVLRGWRLYPYDPRTTDAERQAMGVPPLAELLKGEETLNQRGKPKL